MNQSYVTKTVMLQNKQESQTAVNTVNQRLHCQPAFTLSTSVYIVN